MIKSFETPFNPEIEKLLNEGCVFQTVNGAVIIKDEQHYGISKLKREYPISVKWYGEELGNQVSCQNCFNYTEGRCTEKSAVDWTNSSCHSPSEKKVLKQKLIKNPSDWCYKFRKRK